MEESVVLIVKAPNQQIEDQTVQCEINWTIKKLKDHLTEVYPSKPRLEDQKLIYSGQLLNDNVTLKDVLRIYNEGQENHTVHLVCSPSKESLRAASLKKPVTMSAPQPVSQEQTNSATPSSTNGDGLRQRVGHVYGYPQQQSWPFTLPQPGGQTPPPMWPMFGTYDTANMAQQMAWMQQAYAQYMTQYMQMIASGNVPVAAQTVNAVPPAAAHPPPLREEPVPVNEPAANADEEEMRANRDWLDWIYIVTRMLVLFSIVYFYSSPVRFFVVSTLGIIMYLYQVGFFRAVQRMDQQDDAPITPPPTPDNLDNNNIPPPDTPPPPPSAFAVTWAAFSSFFLSLIPEQPNVL